MIDWKPFGTSFAYSAPPKLASTTAPPSTLSTGVTCERERSGQRRRRGGMAAAAWLWRRGGGGAAAAARWLRRRGGGAAAHLAADAANLVDDLPRPVEIDLHGIVALVERAADHLEGDPTAHCDDRIPRFGDTPDGAECGVCWRRAGA